MLGSSLNRRISVLSVSADNINRQLPVPADFEATVNANRYLPADLRRNRFDVNGL